MTALLSRPKPQGFQLAQKGPAVLPPLRPGRLKGGVKGALRQASVVYDLKPGEGH